MFFAADYDEKPRPQQQRREKRRRRENVVSMPAPNVHDDIRGLVMYSFLLKMTRHSSGRPTVGGGRGHFHTSP